MKLKVINCCHGNEKEHGCASVMAHMYTYVSKVSWLSHVPYSNYK